jgi:hypothetical protein
MKRPGEAAPSEIAAALDQAIGPVTPERRDELARISRKALEDPRIMYCGWWGGCLYCQDRDGNWNLIYCNA